MPSEVAVLSVLRSVRDPIAEYQDARGLSKEERYSFINLFTALLQHAYNAGVTIFTMIYNLLPLMEGFLYFLRFILDKMIDIVETTETQDKVLKSVVFVGELIILFVLLFFIMTILIMPIVDLLGHFTNKIFAIVNGNG